MGVAEASAPSQEGEEEGYDEREAGSRGEGLDQRLILHQQYNSPRCWKTKEQALDQFEKLKTKKDQYKFVKEQILMRYVGLDWPDAHHSWSKGNKVYSLLELLKHLVETVIPMADDGKHKVPKDPPVNLPCRKNHGPLGDPSADLLALDNNCEANKQSLRLRAMKERDRLESNGFGDQMMEMQEATPPIEKIQHGKWRIDMCFEYTDGGESVLHWCQAFGQS